MGALMAEEFQNRKTKNEVAKSIMKPTQKISKKHRKVEKGTG